MEQIAVSPADAAKAIGVHVNTIHNWIGRGIIQSQRVGRRRLVKTDSIRKLLETA